MADLKCVQCGKEFKTDQGLKVHVGVMHGPKDKKPPGKPGRPRKTRLAASPLIPVLSPNTTMATSDS